MAFWDKFKSTKVTAPPVIDFGRFSDAYKSKEQYVAWDQSLRFFEEGRVLDSVRSLVEYMKNKTGSNVQFCEDAKDFCFILYQGSKQITCRLNERSFRAESKIAHCKELNVGFLRKAIEYNYDLNYSRFALDPENNLCILFDSLVNEASPYKLYYGLKELAIQSDKEDDLLLSEFENLEPLQSQHIRNLSPEIMQLKIEFFRQKLNEVHQPEVIGKLNPKRYQGALTYVYLAAVYAIDYIVKPEGALMDMLGRIHQSYFELSSERLDEKVALLQNGFKEMEVLSDADLGKEIYDVISTFGITSPANQSVIAQFIENELQPIRWYEENGHTEVCLAICNYIAGYCLFNFALPSPDRGLLHLYFEISEPAYFTKLGYPNMYYDAELKDIKVDKVRMKVTEIFKDLRVEFPELPYEVELEGTTKSGVLKSLLWIIKNLNIK